MKKYLSVRYLSENPKTGRFHGSVMDIGTFCAFVVFTFIYYPWCVSALIGISQDFIPLPDLFLDIFEGMYYVCTLGYAIKTWKSSKEHKRPGHLFVYMWGVSLAIVWVSQILSFLGVFTLYTFTYSSSYVVFCRVASVIVVTRWVQLLKRKHDELENSNSNSF